MRLLWVRLRKELRNPDNRNKLIVVGALGVLALVVLIGGWGAFVVIVLAGAGSRLA